MEVWKYNYHYMRSAVLMVVLKLWSSWLTLYSFVDKCKRFWGICCLHFRANPGDGCQTMHQKTVVSTDQNNVIIMNIPSLLHPVLSMYLYNNIQKWHSTVLQGAYTLHIMCTGKVNLYISPTPSSLMMETVSNCKECKPNGLCICSWCLRNHLAEPLSETNFYP